MKTYEMTHEPIKHLFYNVLDHETKTYISDFISVLVLKQNNYTTDMLWIADQKIGGVGGYAMPPDPTKNPFNKGIERSLYRPLQYARSNIEINDVRINSRYVIQNSGMHLEFVARLFLKENKALQDLRFNNTTFGKCVSKLKRTGQIDKETLIALDELVKVYNLSKHEVNKDPSRDMFFNAFEGIAYYFSARVIGVKLLRMINYPQSLDVFKINNKVSELLKSMKD